MKTTMEVTALATSMSGRKALKLTSNKTLVQMTSQMLLAHLNQKPLLLLLLLLLLQTVLRNLRKQNLPSLPSLKFKSHLMRILCLLALWQMWAPRKQTCSTETLL